MPSLEKLLRLLPVSPTRFVTAHEPAAPVGGRATFGGTLVAQSVLASLHTVAREFEPSSVHCYFVVGGDPRAVISYEVEALRRGRNFEHREVRAFQHGRLIFVSNVLFHRARGGSGGSGVRGDKSGSGDSGGSGDSNATLASNTTLHRDRILHPLPRTSCVDAARLFRDQVAAHWDRYNHVAHGFDSERHVAAFADRFERGAVEYQFPPDIFYARAPHDHLDYYQRVRRDQVAAALEKDPRFCYVAFAYLSDAYLLLTLPYFHQLPLYSHRFSVSLDHVIHFHARPPVCEWLALRVRNPRSSGDRHLVDGSYYDAASGDIVASVRQEGLVVYDKPSAIRARF